MWFSAVTTTPPTGDVIDLDRAKEFLRVDGDDQDDTTADAITSAVQHVEAYTGTRMLTQTVRLRASGFDDLARLPIGPVQSVTGLAYLDATGTVQVLDASLYELFGDGLDRGIRPIFGQRWPATREVDDAVSVTLIVGYGAGSDVPAPVMRAILLLIGDFYTIRGDTVIERGVTPATLPNGIDTNLVNYRIY